MLHRCGIGGIDGTDGVIDELKNSEDRDRPRIRRQHQDFPLCHFQNLVGFIVTPLRMGTVWHVVKRLTHRGFLVVDIS